MKGHIRGGQVVLPTQLIHLHHVDETSHLLLNGVHAHIAVQLRQQILDTLLGGDLLLLRRLFHLCLFGGLLGFFRLLGGLLRFLFHKRRAPEVGVHAAEVPLGHGADEIHLLQDDFVFSVHITCSSA